MRSSRLIVVALALMLAGSVGGILAWNVIAQTGGAQEPEGAFSEDPFDEGFGEAKPAEPAQVWCEVMFIQMDTADLDEIQARDDALITPTGEKAMLTNQEKQQLLDQLKEKPSFEFVGTASIITISGGQALIQMVEEVRYPTEYDTEPLDEVVPDEPGVPVFEDTAGVPDTFETREVGTRLTMTPTVSSNGKLLTLVVLPEASHFAGWRNLGGAAADQPLLTSWNVTTTLYMLDGMTCVMTGALINEFGQSSAMDPGKLPEAMGKKTSIIMISAKILDLHADSDEDETE